MFYTRKSDNLFETDKKAQRIKQLTVLFPDYDLSVQGEQFLKFKRLKSLEVHTDIFYPHLLPQEIGRLQQLERLSILNMNYEEFPEWVFQLKGLQRLMIRGNDINEIPERIRELESLQHLRMENCSIQEMPKALAALKNLKQLSFRDNTDMVSFPVDSLPENLKVLDLEVTQIRLADVQEIKKIFPRLRMNQFAPM